MTELERIDGYFRAVNYISACQLYLLDNPLLKRPLKESDIKKKIVGHWGTVPGQNFIYTHLDRIINKYDLNMLYISGPGHGGNFMIANTYLEGSYSEIYPEITMDEEGLKNYLKDFLFQVVFQVMLHQRHRALFMKVGNLVILLHMLLVLSLIILV